MKFSSVLCIACVLAAIAQPVRAQERLAYRAYVLGSTIESVLELSGARAVDVRTPYERPAMIQNSSGARPTRTQQASRPTRCATSSFRSATTRCIKCS